MQSPSEISQAIGDSELLAQRINEAFANVRYVWLRHQKPQRFELVGQAVSDNRWRVPPLKFIPSKQPRLREDECWICTAYPIGRKKMRQAQAKGLLLSIEQR